MITTVLASAAATARAVSLSPLEAIRPAALPDRRRGSRRRGGMALVLVIAVAVVVLGSILRRLCELGLLRAVGATPARVRATLLLEAGLMALVGIVYGLIIGVALEWYLLRVALLAETGFVFPVRLPWMQALTIAALALAGSLLAGLGPALRASRLRISEAIALE